MLVRDLNRRSFLQGLAGGSLAAFTTPGLFAQQLAETGTTTEGPFYPDVLPLDTDNDLLVLNDALTPSTGHITYFSGRVLSQSGAPVRNAVVEVWQCDAKGSYLHSKGRGAERDPNFQGYGRVITGSTGEYSFRTIHPVSYAQYGITRAPHIHLAISRNGRRVMTTQVHVAGDPLNANDSVLTRLDAAARATVIAEFRPIPNSPLGEIAARWDVVLGKTALEGDDGITRGAIGKPEGAPAFWDYVKTWEAKQGKTQ